MRLRIGLVLAAIAAVLVLSSLPASWYHVNVVGPNFLLAVGVPDPARTEEIREIDGEFGLYNYHITNSSWQVPPEEYDDPMTVMPLYGQETGGQPVPNENAIEVYAGTTAAVAAAIVALALGAFGAWNIARYDRYRWFTAASLALAAVLLVGGCIYFSSALPGALEADAATGHEDTFGMAFSPYIDTTAGEPGFYSEFAGGYPNNDERLPEQLSYGPGAGWWLAGAGGIFAIIAAAVLVGAPMWTPRRRPRTDVVPAVKYVPVPTTDSLRGRRRYPKRMSGVSGNSPALRKR